MTNLQFKRRNGLRRHVPVLSGRVLVPFAASMFLISSCAADNYPPLLDIEASGLSTSTSASSEEEEPEEEATTSTTARAPAEDGEVQGDWVDVTSNLLDLESTCGNVPFVTSNPETGEVLVNIATRGLYSFDPEAEEWNALGGDGGGIGHRTQWIEFDPEDPDRYWVSGAYGSGVYWTQNGGDSFRRLGSVTHVDRVAVDLDDPSRQTMLLGTHERTSVLLSENGGDTWGEIASGLPSDVGFTANPAIVDSDFLIGSYGSRDSGIYRSDDKGDSWEQVFIGGVYGAPVNGDGYIAWNLDTGDGGLAVSTDGGRSFFATSARSGSRSQTLIHLPNGSLVSTGKNGLAISDDVGGSWRPFGPSLSFQPWAVAYSEQQSAFFIWTFTCSFGPEGNPVLPESIMMLKVDPELVGAEPVESE